ncbi:ring canal kelch homolog [Metopolophium dirhodum]|uniref:ring canal kelch homolog n=1 Tax=Metopolophium dirhodum TaxID=44670 RepID=UPI0029900D2A|nr:ring canal kelch homolog [Metopolophium dirhodum]
MQNTMQIQELCEPPKYVYKKTSYAEMLKILESLRQDEMFCDIKLKTDSGGIISGHKVILASACSYFQAMFTNFAEKNQDIVVIKHIHHTALQILIDFLYTGVITVTENNARVLLEAANLLQIQEVKDACVEFLQTQLCLTNCIDTYALADLHDCTELIRRSELYIQQHFSHVVELDEFLSISSEQMVKLIASEELIVLSERKVFESVIQWVKHDVISRNCVLPQLMEHIRLPLTSKDYILKKVLNEPLIYNCLKSQEYANEAFDFQFHKSDELVTIPNNIRTKPRQRSGSHKVILLVGGLGLNTFTTELYDPKINQWQYGPQMITQRIGGGLAVVKENFVFFMGGFCHSRKTHRSVYVLDFSSELLSWKPSIDMIVPRQHLGVGIINNYIYAVGGADEHFSLNSAEVFDCSTQEWCMISSMSTRRNLVGIGVLNNLLYAVGGNVGHDVLNSVECYHPCLDKWTPIANMHKSRCGVGVGVLNDVLYAVGGFSGKAYYKSVEAYRPSTGVWTTIPYMHEFRGFAGVAVLDGLLYVIGGSNSTSQLNSAEFYNPNTNTWTMVTASMNIPRDYLGAVVIDKP